MSALITGGAGYLGRHLARSLAEQGQEVTVLDDLSCPNSRFDLPELDHPRIHCILGSTLDAELLAPLVRSHRTVVHFSSVVGVEETIRQPFQTVRNLEGTRNLISELTGDHTAIFGSSADVYGMHSLVYDRAMREDDLEVFEHAGVNRWVYPKVKALEELLFAHTPARTMSIRFFNCYGPGMDQPYAKRVVPQFVRQILRREPLQVSLDGMQTRTFCYFQDLIDGVTMALRFLEDREVPYSVTLNLGGTDTVSILELAHKVVEAAMEVGLIEESLPIETQAELYSRPFNDSWNRVPDLDRARRLLGYEPKVSFENGLRRTLGFHLEEPVVYRHPGVAEYRCQPSTL